MGYAKHVGRVGALALALGIGTAVATPAWAEAPSGSESSSSASETSQKPSSRRSTPTASGESTSSGDSAGTSDSDGSTAPTGGSGTNNDAADDEADVEIGPESEDVEEAPLLVGNKVVEESDAHDEGSASAPTEVTSSSSMVQSDDTTPSDYDAPADDTPASATPDQDPEPAGAETTDAPVPSSYALAVTAPRVEPAPAPLVRQPQGPVGVILGGPTALLDIAAKALHMLFNPSPTVPGDPPLLLGVLAFVRREIQRTFFNSSPTAVADSTSTSEGLPTRISVLDNDIDPNIGDVLTVTDFTQAANGVVELNTDGSFTYTPTAGFSGTDTFTYTISDEASGWHGHVAGLLKDHTSTATVSVTVLPAPVNEPPSAADDSATTAEDTPAVIDVRSNDSDPDGDDISIASVGAAQHGTVAVLDGKITYTPEANFHGTDTFDYTITDGELTDTATVTVTVTPVNDAPVAVHDAVTVAGSPVANVINVLGNDSDPDTEDTLTVTEVGAPNHGGTVTIIDGSAISYAPAAGYSGTETFSYTVSDGTEVAIGTVTVNVAPVGADNSPPVFANPPLSEDGLSLDPETGVITGRVIASDPEGQAIEFAIAEAPEATHAQVSIDPSTGEFRFVPTDLARFLAAVDPASQTISFKISASDGVHVRTINFAAPVAPKHPADDGVLDLADLDTLAQYGVVQVSENDNGSIGAIIGKFTSRSVRNEDDALWVMNQVAQLLGAPGGLTGVINTLTTDFPIESGVSETYYRLVQTIAGVRVLGSDVILSTLTDGSVTGVFSNINPAIYGLSTTPAPEIDEDAEAVAVAAQILLESLDAPLSETEANALLSSLTFTPRLAIHSSDDEPSPLLVWVVDISTPFPTDEEADPVDADDTTYATRYLIHANGDRAGTLFAEVTGVTAAISSVAQTASGLSHGDVPRIYTFTAQQNGSQLKMKDVASGITVYRGVVETRGRWVWNPLPTYERYVVGLTPDGNVITKNSLVWDPSAVSAMANMSTVYRFYKEILGWDFNTRVPNPKGIQVGVVDSIHGGAVWNAGLLNFTFGEDTEAALDSVGHEFTHAVIQSILPDEWQFTGSQGAALNEAYGDILGGLIEAKNDAGRWLVAEDAAGKPWRDMKNTSQTGVENPGPNHFRNFDAAAGGHFNASIFNHAAFLMINDDRTAGITRETWARIFYSSLHRLPSNATFQNARNAVIAAASAQGLTRDQQEVIANAFSSVGITETPRVKIVLRWGMNPADLDSHLTGPSSRVGERFHIYYAQRNFFRDGTYSGQTGGNQGRLAANLDYDDVDYEGPETTTIRDLVPGDYYFYVRDFTNGGSTSSTDLSQSGATVTVLMPGQNTGGTVFRVGRSIEGTTWTVFKLSIRADGSTSLTPINSYGYDEPYRNI